MLAYETLVGAKNATYILVLLNAFNNDVYYGLYSINKNNLELVMPKGYENIDSLLEIVKKRIGDESVLCMGNGAALFEEKIGTLLKNIVLLSPSLDVASAKHIGLMALEKWNDLNGISKYVLPLYLKSQAFKPKYSND